MHTLDLSFNSLTNSSLSSLNPSSLLQLRRLNLSSNTLTSLIPLAGGWVQLQQLQLEGNRISDLSAAGIDQLQKKAPTLTIISLSNREGVSNPSECSGDSVWKKKRGKQKASDNWMRVHRMCTDDVLYLVVSLQSVLHPPIAPAC